MRPNPYVVQALKYATFTLLGCSAVVIVIALTRNTETSSFTGRLTPPQERGIIPTNHFTAERAIEGFPVMPDTHTIFSIPEGVRITRITFFGGPPTDAERYWGYCFSGNENANKQRGLRGKDMYDGQFFYSIGERKAQSERVVPADNNLIGILDSTTEQTHRAPASIAEIFKGGQTCYVMSSVPLPAAVDTSDEDGLNTYLERELGTNPNNPDTDGDGIPDGTEVFRTKTSPLQGDTDKDGLSDSCEDSDKNGVIEKGETSALVADTDRDGLCDGNGYGNGCPEPRQVVCSLDVHGERHCSEQPSSPVFGEDMNLSCSVDEGETDPRNPETFGMPDWDYKWSVLRSETGDDSLTDSAKGVDAPDVSIPIPDLP